MRAMGSGSGRFRSATAGDGGDDGDLVARLERGLGALEKADVFLVDVEVDEAADLTAIVNEALLEARVLLLEVLDEAAHGVGGRLHLRLALGERAERRRNSYEYRHGMSPCFRLRRRLWISGRPAPGRTRPATGGWSRPRKGGHRRRRVSLARFL